MRIDHIEYKEVEQLSKKDLDYIKLEDYLLNFYAYRPDMAGFKKAIEERKTKPVNRVSLHKVVSEAYKAVKKSDRQEKSIEALLSDNTFTIITAHQPVLFGGPMYYIYKICSVINLSRQLNDKFPDTHVVPIFINGSEDHDFEEIDHFNIYGKDVKWERSAVGPVGRLSLEGLDKVLTQLEEILGSGDHAQAMLATVKKAYDSANNYNDFVFQFVNSLFGATELLVVNTDNAELKRSFIPVLKEELINRPSQKIIFETQERLAEHSFKAQAYPRDINLFYLGNGDRQRITFEDGVYQIVDTDQTFTEAEILAELDNHPEHFSPNVAIRPLYQEYIFPNLAYIGGGGEIAYWLERKEQFQHFNVFYPMLIRRNSAMVLNKSMQKQMSQLQLDTTQIFRQEDVIINDFLLAQTDEEITIESELATIQEAYESIASKAKVHDPTLEKAILADMTKHLKQVENLGGRIKRVIKSREETNVNKIKKIKEKLFPSNGLQERHDNFIQYYAELGPELIDYLIENLDPLDRRFVVIST